MAPGEDDSSITLRKLSHKSVELIAKSIEDFRFNTGIATIYEWLKGIRKAKADPATLGARFEAASMLARALTPFMPHLAEEAWEALGQKGFISNEAWPKTDAAFLAVDSVLMPIQINGKVRGRMQVDPAADKDTVEAQARAETSIQSYLAGKTIRKVIVIPGRIVNIVVS